MAQKVLIDWLTISSKIHSPQTWIDDIGMRDVDFTLGSGRNGYRQGLTSGGVSVWFDGTRGKPDERGDSPMGTCLNMSGQGCRKFETDGNGDFMRLLEIALENEGEMNITRLDIAYDDHDGLLPLDLIFWDTQQQAFVSKFQYWEIINSSKGLTVQHGSDSSDVLIRIYDKALERGFDDGRHWVRCELQLRRAAATGAAKQLVGGGEVGELLAGILRNYLRFIEEGYEDKYRAPVRPYWSRFLDDAAGVRVVDKPGMEYNALNLEDYIIGQAGNSIYTYIKIFGVDHFLEKLREKDKKLNDNQRRLLDEFGRNFDV